MIRKIGLLILALLIQCALLTDFKWFTNLFEIKSSKKCNLVYSELKCMLCVDSYHRESNYSESTIDFQFQNFYSQFYNNNNNS